MDDRRVMSMALSQGETRQLLLVAGSMVLVIGGPIKLRFPFEWLGETMVASEVILSAEQVQIIEKEEWVSVQAPNGGQMVVIPPDGFSLWRQVGRCLETFFGNRQKTAAEGRRQA